MRARSSSNGFKMVCLCLIVLFFLCPQPVILLFRARSAHWNHMRGYKFTSFNWDVRRQTIQNIDPHFERIRSDWVGLANCICEWQLTMHISRGPRMWAMVCLIWHVTHIPYTVRWTGTHSPFASRTTRICRTHRIRECSAACARGKSARKDWAKMTWFSIIIQMMHIMHRFIHIVSPRSLGRLRSRSVSADDEAHAQNIKTGIGRIGVLVHVMLEQYFVIEKMANRLRVNTGMSTLCSLYSAISFVCRVSFLLIFISLLCGFVVLFSWWKLHTFRRSNWIERRLSGDDDV